jgi:dUTP pyrophosphatase
MKKNYLSVELQGNYQKDKIYFSKVNPNAIIPSKLDENAGYDVYACFEEDFIWIRPNETKMIPTGIASACSSDYYFQLFERGSTGTKGIGQRCGVIDSGYRNEWFVPITNHNDKHLIIIKENVSKSEVVFVTTRYNDNIIFYPYEKAICQVVLLPVPKVKVEEIDYDKLVEMKSIRGLGMLGDSGK